MINSKVKSHYLPSTNSIIIGIAFTFLLFGLFLIGLDTKASLWDNFQSMVLDFRDVVNFLASLLMLMIKILLIKLVYVYFKNSNKIEQARIDNKGFYYKDKVNDRYEFLTYEGKDLIFVPFRDIQEISLKRSFWMGDQIQLSTIEGKKTLIALNPLKKSEKTEIVKIIQAKINSI